LPINVNHRFLRHQRCILRVAHRRSRKLGGTTTLCCRPLALVAAIGLVRGLAERGPRAGGILEEVSTAPGRVRGAEGGVPQVILANSRNLISFWKKGGKTVFLHTLCRGASIRDGSAVVGLAIADSSAISASRP
jgi:hypothetical protein